MWNATFSNAVSAAHDPSLQQTTIAQLDIPLPDFPSFYKQFPDRKSFKALRRSKPDPELGISKCSTLFVEPTAVLPRGSPYLNNKLAWITLLATVIFGVTTIIWQGISIVPTYQGVKIAMQGIQLQTESEADGRQGIAYSFMQECANRKTQDLPLGPDCIKYLIRTPKAPPDIEMWLVESLPTNLTSPTNGTSPTIGMSPNNVTARHVREFLRRPPKIGRAS